MTKKKRYKKVVKRKMGDFWFVYLFVSLVYSTIGCLVSFSGWTGDDKTILVVCGTFFLWIWIPIYFMEVEKEVYFLRR